MADRRLSLAALAWAAACGSAVPTEQASESTTGAPSRTSTSSGSGVATSSSSSTSTSSGATSSETSAESTTTGIADVALEPCDCNFLCPLCVRPGCVDYDQWCTEHFECDLWEQNCGADEKCMPWANDGGQVWNATRCVPLAPEPAQVGEPCAVAGTAASGIDNCDTLQLCFDIDDRNNGTCVGFCSGAREDLVCPTGLSCAVTNDGLLALCRPPCDPLQQACADGQGCFPTVAGAFVCMPAPSEAIASPHTCHLSGGCEPGTICRTPDTVPGCDDEGGCCSPYCDLTDPTCPASSTCIPFFERAAPAPELEHVGVCGLPVP